MLLRDPSKGQGHTIDTGYRHVMSRLGSVRTYSLPKVTGRALSWDWLTQAEFDSLVTLFKSTTYASPYTFDGKSCIFLGDTLQFECTTRDTCVYYSVRVEIKHV